MSPVETLSLVGDLLVLCLLDRFNQPNLVASLMNVILKDSLALFSFATCNIESSGASMSLDDVSLVSEFSLFCSLDLEVAAGMLSSVSDDVDSVVDLILKDA